ncbi:hypothetical protein CANARDRAFT_19079 [[Candida] arabinofermentans NRRL YB-2248]|uniref:Uncharacterized protein n=1 Tax=[Candida] arabinofermentans NRRL YB-2248 TaxID=983967 RepID=A0A1E4SWL2_9ASCO|nr:hypothetical protein CANARDRAFT_19079 [[Candida] arabinofermentans NRRL YB-2248]
MFIRYHNTVRSLNIRCYHIQTPSILPCLKSVEKPLSYKYNNYLEFRKKADSRIKILNEIIPVEFKLDNHLLLRCIYTYEQSHPIKTKLVDNLWLGADVSIENDNVKKLGEKLLKQRVLNYTFQTQITHRDDEVDEVDVVVFDKLDLFDSVLEKSYKLTSLTNRVSFINQFLKKLESNSKLDLSLDTYKLIKLEENKRHKIIWFVIGFIYYQYGFNKCVLFIDEKIINMMG